MWIIGLSPNIFGDYVVNLYKKDEIKKKSLPTLPIFFKVLQYTHKCLFGTMIHVSHAFKLTGIKLNRIKLFIELLESIKHKQRDFT